VAKGKKTGITEATIELAHSYARCSEVLAHLRHESARVGFELSQVQWTALHDLDDGPDEIAIALLHAWWCYDVDKLKVASNLGVHPKPRVYLSLHTNQRGRLILSWSPVARNGDRLEESDFRQNPCRPYAKEDRLVEVREFDALTIFHEPRDPEDSTRSFDVRAGVSENVIIANALLLQAAAALIKELKSRLSHCFTVTMIDDIYVEWQSDPARKLDLKASIKTFEIKNVATHEGEKASKLLDAFENTFKCPLSRFVEVAFAPDVKPRSGPCPSPHTKPERSARRFKALGHPVLTPSVVRLYVGLIHKYRPHLLPPSEASSANVLPFTPKK
jgi:hypothetical protein